MDKPKTYNIDGTIYEQRPLVYAQWQQIANIMDGIPVPKEINSQSLIIALSQKLDLALAVLLTKQGTQLKDKDINKLAEGLSYSLLPSQIDEILTDFFTYNNIESMANLISGLLIKIWTAMEQRQKLLYGKNKPGQIKDKPMN